MPDTRYKPKTRRLGTVKYIEPNPQQSRGSYIYQFYRLNKKLIDAAYSGIGVADPYMHFKAETLDLLSEQPSKPVTWATRYQIGKGSVVTTAGGNTAINNLIRSIRRAGATQALAKLAGYTSSAHIGFYDLRSWSYSAGNQQYYFHVIGKNGEPRPDKPTVALWFSNSEGGKYKVGGAAYLHMASPLGDRVFKLLKEALER